MTRTLIQLKERVLAHVIKKWKGKSRRDDWIRSLHNINKIHSLSPPPSLSYCSTLCHVGFLLRLFPHNNKTSASNSRSYILFKISFPAEQPLDHRLCLGNTHVPQPIPVGKEHVKSQPCAQPLEEGGAGNKLCSDPVN